MSLPVRLTKDARVFLKPRNATHRQYEALRAFFVEGLKASEAAVKFGQTYGSFQLTLMAKSRYCLLGAKVGNGYTRDKSSHIVRDLIDATANVSSSDDAVMGRFGKRARNPLLLAADFAATDEPIPWWGNRIW